MECRLHDDLSIDLRQQRRAEIRNVIALAIPNVILNSARALLDLADFILVTRLNSPDAQAAILSAQLYLWVYSVFGMGVVTMASTFASQCLGKQQHKEAGRYAWQTVYIAVFFGVIGLALYPILPWLFRTVGHEPGVMNMEIAYAQVALLTIGPTIASTGLAAFYTGIHRPYLAMWSVLEANALNVLVAIVLMFGYFGFAPMGLVGAAWATFAALCYRTVRLAVPLLMPSFHNLYHTRETWRPSWPHIADLFRIGMPVALQWTSEILVWTLFVSVLIGRFFGTADLIATNATWQYLRLAFLPTVGVGQSLTALVGKAIGAGDTARAIRDTRFAAILTVVYMGAIALVYALFGSWLIGLFNADPEVIRVGRWVMVCAAAFQIFDALAITYVSALRGAGDTFIPSIILSLSLWIVVIGAGWAIAVLFPGLRSIGPWMAAALLIMLTSGFLWWRWSSGAWRKLDIFRSTPASD